MQCNGCNECNIRRMDGCNSNSELAHVFENRHDCKCLFQSNTVPLKILDHCKPPPEIMTVQFKYMAASALLKLQYALNKISGKYFIYKQVMVASALLK